MLLEHLEQILEHLEQFQSAFRCSGVVNCRALEQMLWILEQICSKTGTFGTIFGTNLVNFGTKLAKPAHAKAYELVEVLVTVVRFSSPKPDQATKIMRYALPSIVLRQGIEAATCSVYLRLMDVACSLPLSKQDDPLPEKTQSSASLSRHY